MLEQAIKLMEEKAKEHVISGVYLEDIIISLPVTKPSNKRMCIIRIHFSGQYPEINEWPYDYMKKYQLLFNNRIYEEFKVMINVARLICFNSKFVFKYQITEY